ncbi:MAG: hypothetical protein M1838_002703 [Thelocarpon superellum]|nr:MAG: hypothetical protein M1838_002703 [Thelocarpon superellum]
MWRDSCTPRPSPFNACVLTMEWNEALSGVFGSISLAAWIFLLVPQLIENYQQGSADGISLAFLTVWFIGDLTNFFGAIWAGLVPTVIALAVYFCFADLVLITQCVYYNVINARKERHRRITRSGSSDVDESDRPLLDRRSSDNLGLPGSRRRSSASHARRESYGGTDGGPSDVATDAGGSRRTWMRNGSTMVMICLAGAAGWFVAWQFGAWNPVPNGDPSDAPTDIALGAQILGYISAVCYLGARIPQIVKNHRERSCEGLSLLFFMLSILGNATYGAGILFHSIERQYVITNLPWLIGSLGTMVEDVVIFVQFRLYAGQSDAKSSVAVM